MGSRLDLFEKIARSTRKLGARDPIVESDLHPFDLRNIHPRLPTKVRKLFDDGHCPEATFEAFKFLDKKVQECAGIVESGHKLMMAAFNSQKPLVKLTSLSTTSERDEQEGFGSSLLARYRRFAIHAGMSIASSTILIGVSTISPSYRCSFAV